MSREEFRRVVTTDPVDVGLACLLMGTEVEPDLDVSICLAAFDALALKVPAADPSDPPACALALRTALSTFSGTPQDYANPKSVLLHEVIRLRRGLPIMLAVVWLEVAKRAGLPAFPVGLPGFFLVGVGTRDGPHVLVDVFAGGDLVEGPPPRSRPYNDRELVLRVLNNVRAQAVAIPGIVESARTALWATDLSLLLPRHPASLRRERGLLLARLGSYADGAAELEAYADGVAEAEEAVAEEARREARLARARLN